MTVTGDRVKTSATVRPTVYADRIGTVVDVNLRDNEVGVWLGNSGPDHNRIAIWFRSDEIAAVDPLTTAPECPRAPRGHKVKAGCQEASRGPLSGVA
jgi:hypothetical protein